MKRLPLLLLLTGLTGILALGAFWTPAAQADSKGKFTLDVAMGDAPPGVNLPDPLPNTALDGRGVVVLASGNIYPEDTLPSGESSFDPNESGAIGSWYCHFVGLGASEFPLVGAVTYFFKLDETGNDPEESMIIVRGLNSHTPDFRDSVPRVLATVGGTGRFARVSGQVVEEVIGTNISGSRNLRFEFQLRGVKRGRR